MKSAEDGSVREVCLSVDEAELTVVPNTYEGTELHCDLDGRGNGTIAAKDFEVGEIIFAETPLAIIYPSRLEGWLLEARKDLESMDKNVGWLYHAALFCIAESEHTGPPPPQIELLTEAQHKKFNELCGHPDDLLPTDLALAAAGHFLKAACASTIDQAELEALASCIENASRRIARNAFQILNVKLRPPTVGEGLGHRMSFVNHCCGSMHNSTWVYNSGRHLLMLKAVKPIKAGDELSITYIAKPWSVMGKAARMRYIQAEYGFTCLCKCCSQAEPESMTSSESERPKDLTTLLTLWMQKGDPSKNANCDKENADTAQPDSKQAPKPKSTGPVDDEERVSRVLARLSQEGREVTREMVVEALEAEGNHVGKAVIRLKKSCPVRAE